MGWRDLGWILNIKILFGIYIGALKMQVGWQGLGGVASPWEGSRIMLGIYKRALKMQVGWQGLSGLAGF